jgi:hypothetical protein
LWPATCCPFLGSPEGRLKVIGILAHYVRFTDHWAACAYRNR